MSLKIYAQTLKDFNPRSHERSDPWSASVRPTIGISIHAPTRGATMRSGLSWNLSTHFNPRSHERSDEDAKDNVQKAEISIHAPTRGATKSVDDGDMMSEISIHAPTRGATFIGAVALGHM